MEVCHISSGGELSDKLINNVGVAPPYKDYADLEDGEALSPVSDNSEDYVTAESGVMDTTEQDVCQQWNAEEFQEEQWYSAISDTGDYRFGTDSTGCDRPGNGLPHDVLTGDYQSGDDEHSHLSDQRSLADCSNSINTLERFENAMDSSSSSGLESPGLKLMIPRITEDSEPTELVKNFEKSGTVKGTDFICNLPRFSSKSDRYFEKIAISDLGESVSDGDMPNSQVQCSSNAIVRTVSIENCTPIKPNELVENSCEPFVTVSHVGSGQYDCDIALGDSVEIYDQNDIPCSPSSPEASYNGCTDSVSETYSFDFESSHSNSVNGEFEQISTNEVLSAISNDDDDKNWFECDDVSVLSQRQGLNSDLVVASDHGTIFDRVVASHTDDGLRQTADRENVLSLNSIDSPAAICGDPVKSSSCDSESIQSIIEECLNSIDDPSPTPTDQELTSADDVNIAESQLSDLTEDFTIVEIHKTVLVCSDDPAVEALQVITDVRSLPTGSKTKQHRVTFPDDLNLVSSYLSPEIPWKDSFSCSTEDLVLSYRSACSRLAIKPIAMLLVQLQTINSFDVRMESLNLKGESLDWRQCDALEEVLRRVQFLTVDVEATRLDEESSVILFEMIEFYESCTKLNISSNSGLGIRGWQACWRMLKKTSCLDSLDARGCSIPDQVMPLLSRALQTASCQLHTLHLENSIRSGRHLILLVSALRCNETVTELYLGGNQLLSTDGAQLGGLLKYNSTIRVLDLRNNLLQDVGLARICDGIFERPTSQPTSLTTLIMWNNQLTYESMMSLSKMLAFTQSLETLNLGHNNLTNEGMHRLKDGLLQNQSLLRFGLQSTKISCEGAVALAEFIAESSRLIRLDLRANGIKTAGLMALMLSLKVSQTVTAVDLDQDTKKDGSMKDYANQQRRLLLDISVFVERNKKLHQQQEDEAKIAVTTDAPPFNHMDSPTMNVEQLSLYDLPPLPLLDTNANVPTETSSAGGPPSPLTLALCIATRVQTLESPAFAPNQPEPFVSMVVSKLVEDSDEVKSTVVASEANGENRSGVQGTVFSSVASLALSKESAPTPRAFVVTEVKVDTVIPTPPPPPANPPPLVKQASKRKFTVSKAMIPFVTAAQKTFVSTAVLYTARPPPDVKDRDSDSHDDDTHVCIVGTTSEPVESKPPVLLSTSTREVPHQVPEMDLHPLIKSFSASAVVSTDSNTDVIAPVAATDIVSTDLNTNVTAHVAATNVTDVARVAGVDVADGVAAAGVGGTMDGNVNKPVVSTRLSDVAPLADTEGAIASDTKVNFNTSVPGVGVTCVASTDVAEVTDGTGVTDGAGVTLIATDTEISDNSNEMIVCSSTTRTETNALEVDPSGTISGDLFLCSINDADFLGSVTESSVNTDTDIVVSTIPNAIGEVLESTEIVYLPTPVAKLASPADVENSHLVDCISHVAAGHESVLDANSGTTARNILSVEPMKDCVEPEGQRKAELETDIANNTIDCRLADNKLRDSIISPPPGNETVPRISAKHRDISVSEEVDVNREYHVHASIETEEPSDGKSPVSVSDNQLQTLTECADSTLSSLLQPMESDEVRITQEDPSVAIVEVATRIEVIHAVESEELERMNEIKTCNSMPSSVALLCEHCERRRSVSAKLALVLDQNLCECGDVCLVDHCPATNEDSLAIDEET